MKNKLTSPILVTGCPRSGTSIIAGMLELCGAFVGNAPQPVKDESRSMKENRRVYISAVLPYLLEAGIDPTGQHPIFYTDIPNMPAEIWRQQIATALSMDNYKEGPWLYKSNVASIMWKVWHEAFPNAKWIIVRRRTGDIVSSCLNTAYMKAFKDQSNIEAIGAETEHDAWIKWVRLYESFFIDMITAGLNCKIVWPERFVQGDYEQLHEIIDWTGLKWRPAVLDYLNPILWKEGK